MSGVADSSTPKTAITRSNPNGGLFGRRDWICALLLVAATLVAYLPALGGQFIWDDDSWTTNIAGLLRDVSGLGAIWCQPTALQQYYPLTGTTFWLDYHFWGFWPLPYHMENILLHALAVLLFWRLLQRLQMPGAWLAAAIFALHPIMVESVAWITERKNVLSLVLYLGALLAYGRFVLYWKEEDDSPVSNTPARCWGAHGLAFALFLCALLAKATAFSLPAVILLVCWWKRGRIRWRADALPVLPFFALAIGFGLVTAWLEKNHLGAKGAEWAISFPDRCLIAGRVPWFYIGKLLWPANLCFVYPRWRPDTASLTQWIYPITALGALVALWLARRRLGRGPAAAAFFFAGTLFPVLGFMNAYYMRYSFVCDHWTYLSSLGLIALGAALVARAVEYLRAPAVLYGFAVTVLPVLAILTWRQCGMYADIKTLWQTTIRLNPNCWMVYNNLGLDSFQKGNVGEAIAYYQKALEFNPDLEEAHYNLGLALFHKDEVDEAITQYQRALQINPDYAEAHNNLGDALLKKGNVDEAIIRYQKALEINPDLAEAHNNLGLTLFRKGNVDEAIAHYQRALEIKPDFAEAHYNLGSALLKKGNVDEAIAHCQKALQINPDSMEAHNNLGNAFRQMGRMDEAIVHYQKALQIKPDNAEVQNNLARVLATCPQASLRNGNKAVELAQRANQLTGDGNPVVLGTLAAAYAEAGRFPEAVKTAQRALQLAETQSNTALADAIRSQLKLYQAGIPFHLH